MCEDQLSVSSKVFYRVRSVYACIVNGYGNITFQVFDTGVY